MEEFRSGLLEERHKILILDDPYLLPLPNLSIHNHFRVHARISSTLTV